MYCWRYWQDTIHYACALPKGGTSRRLLISVYIPVYSPVYIPVYFLCLSEQIRVYSYVYSCVYSCVFVCISEQIRVYSCVHSCAYSCAYSCISVCIFLCVYSFIFVCISKQRRVYSCAYSCVYLPLCIYEWFSCSTCTPRTLSRRPTMSRSRRGRQLLQCVWRWRGSNVLSLQKRPLLRQRVPGTNTDSHLVDDSLMLHNTMLAHRGEKATPARVFKNDPYF